ncbi:hypothetical protein ABPS01_07865 [Streptococcus sp. ZJ151]|uniref:hypothetical protein n=1 Tax=Streptococcus jiangjianxini TaxID=3161189 RepID=UPI0032EB9672
MKKNIAYYWRSFCVVNATLCLVAAIANLLFPDHLAIWDTSTICYIFFLPLIISNKIDLKSHYRAIIGLFLILVVNPILEKLVPITIYLSTQQIFLLSLFFGLLTIGNYRYQKRKNTSQ